MARLSAAGAGAPITPTLTEESEERSPTGAGAVAASNASINTRQRDNASAGTMFSNTAHTDAMGQNESRETVRSRNHALHRAGNQAHAPRAGKLPSRSGALSHEISGQRRLGKNVLADANTYDVPSDEDRAPSRRQPATTAHFSSLKRQVIESREERRRQEEVDRQTALDWQLESARVMEDIESRREESRADLSDEDAAVHEVPDSDVSAIQHDADAEEPELSTNALDESIHALSQQGNPTKKRGRPRKSREVDEAQEIAGDQPRRKRGRPSNAQKKADARRLAAQEAAEASSNLQGPSRMTDELVGPDSPPQAAPIAAQLNPHLVRSLRTTAGPSAASSASDRRLRQASTNGVVQNSSDSGHRSAANTDDEPPVVEDIDTELPDIVHPEELGDMDNGEDNDQTHAADDQPAGEVDGDGGGPPDNSDGDEDGYDDEYDDGDDEDEDDQVDETEIQLEPKVDDRHRLYGQWHKVREVMREVHKHRGSKVRIKDHDFKQVMQACRKATITVRAVTANISQDDLYRIIVDCQTVIIRARSICDGGQMLTNSKKRGFHIFKHLLPTLAGLMKAVIKAFERVAGVGSLVDQITHFHLFDVLELLSIVVQCGEFANKIYRGLSRTIKQRVHTGITMHLRELYSSLRLRYDTDERHRRDQQRSEEIALEIAAQDEEREQHSQRKKQELHNQEKWKAMNKVRLAISFNSGNMQKQFHLRSCSMHVVKTDADGQPYLPIDLREKRGEWSMLELDALETSLQRHADTSAPICSKVFEKLIAEQCLFRRPLADKNLLEIVIKSNELKNFYVQRSRNTGVPVEDWVEKIPRWMDPPRIEHDDGSSAEDAIII
jgi:hypothetical protein